MRKMNKLASFVNKATQGDCVALMKSLPENCIDLIFADPPYNLQLKQELCRPDSTKVKAVCDSWDKFSSFKEYDQFSKKWLKECRRLLKPEGSLWVIGSYHNIFRVGAVLQDTGFWILNDVVWVKANPMPNFRGVRFANAHETLIWAAKSPSSRPRFHYKSMKAFNEDRQMRSDWFLPICSGKERLRDRRGLKAHSTQKPEALLQRVMLACSRPGDLVLDPFFGSGTTGAVAKHINRRFIGFEREARYVKSASQRIENVRALDPELTAQPLEKARPRLPFGFLVESGLIPPGERLYSRDKKRQAFVLAGGALQSGSHIGSIHKLGALLKGESSCNGWKFWHVLRGGELVLLDKLRERFLQTHSASVSSKEQAPQESHFKDTSKNQQPFSAQAKKTA